MKILIVVLLAAIPTLMLAGCGEKDPGSTSKPGTPAKLPDEFTSEKEIPSILENELTPEEKSALLQEIMPAGPGNEATPEEKILQLRKAAEAGAGKAQKGLGVMVYPGHAISRGASDQT